MILSQFRSLLWIVFLTIAMPGTVKGACQLCDQLQRAKEGDYIVAAINNTYTVLLVREKLDHQLSFEEITVSKSEIPQQGCWCGWKEWAESGAPGNCSWAMYTLHIPSGDIREHYSYSNQLWSTGSQADSFISTLLSLRLVPIPKSEMKKVGPRPPEGVPDNRKIWRPRMVFEGQVIENANFAAWRTRWPYDRSDLSGQNIIIYLPTDERRYPSYFPYWLQVQGFFGKAKVQIVDSGKNLTSPMPPPPRRRT